MEKALIDTDIWFDIGQGTVARVRENADAYWSQYGVFTIAAVSVAEIVRGLVRRNRQNWLQRWNEQRQWLEILPVDAAIGELTGEIYARLDERGTPIGTVDPFIAATAIVHGRTLVTANTRHYQRIIEAGFALRLANWRE